MYVTPGAREGEEERERSEKVKYLEIKEAKPFLHDHKHWLSRRRVVWAEQTSFYWTRFRYWVRRSPAFQPPPPPPTTLLGIQQTMNSISKVQSIFFAILYSNLISSSIPVDQLKMTPFKRNKCLHNRLCGRTENVIFPTKIDVTNAAKTREETRGAKLLQKKRCDKNSIDLEWRLIQYAHVLIRLHLIMNWFYFSAFSLECF